MDELRPCGECRRHVVATEAACPFCGAAREASTPSSLRFGRMSRAAVFAGAAIASTACGGKKPKAEAIDNTQTAAPIDAAVEHTDPKPDPHNLPMPYGAPPARRRLV